MAGNARSITSPRDAAARLQRTVDEILNDVRRMSDDLVTWKPAANVWSVMENLCHIDEFIPFWTTEAINVVNEPGRTWGRDQTDTQRLGAIAKAPNRTRADVERTIREGVADTVAKLSALGDADLAIEALSRNPRWGVKPAAFIVDELIVGHVAKHLGQIRRNVAQYSGLLFAVPPAPSIAVRGRAERFPIRRIFCVGRNYEAHAKEMGAVVDRDAPFYFTKAAEHYAPSGSTVSYGLGTSNYHYEMELVAAIGTPAFRVSAADAEACVFGYACGLDMTRRDLQLAAREQRRPWDLAKDGEQSAIISELVPASEIGHVRGGQIELRVNGETKQRADVSQMIHGVTGIVAHLSTFYHLQPGDVIFTGTPEGVGPVHPGDRIDGSIEGVGTIAVTIGQAP